MSAMLIGADITSKMLSALTLEPEIISTELEIVPLDEQKRYLKRHIDSVSRDDKKAIGDVLVRNNKHAEHKWCSAGTAINLDALPPYVVTQMYELIRYKMENKK